MERKRTGHSVSEMISHYQCPEYIINSVFMETWFCSRKQYGIGQYVKEFSKRSDWKNWTQYGIDTAKEDDRTLEYLSYEWKPMSCSLPEFNAAAFAKKLGKNSIYIIGDSLSDQQFVALACALGSEVKSIDGASSEFIGTVSNQLNSFYVKHPST
jgi:hypothetical protein